MENQAEGRLRHPKPGGAIEAAYWRPCVRRFRCSACLIATGFGVGYVPVLPGTVGSGVGLLLFLLLRDLPGLFLIFFVVVFFMIGFWASERCEGDLNQRDPSCIVVDEIHAMLWLLLCLPPSVTSAAVSVAWRWWVAAFCLFRIFDIAKPPPIRQMEHLPGGWGIMIDDGVAAAYALAILWGVYLFPPAWGGAAIWV